jgi:putative hemolysin
MLEWSATPPRAPSPSAAAHLEVRLADNAADVRAAQRLRYAVFAEELGAVLPDAPARIDRDRLDRFCDHLIVRAPRGRVVGTYRMLPPERVAAAGGWYCSTEFDTRRLASLAGGIVEIGRACVHPAYRNGRTISLLWGGLLRYVLGRGYRHAVGCASIATSDGGHVAATLCRRLLAAHLAPAAWRVTPYHAFVLEGWGDVDDAPMPPLLKGYLRLGARVCGAPAWDDAFKTADVLMMLPVAEMSPRYVDRLLRAA